MDTEGSVLVVDDDAGLCEAIAAALGPRYRVRTVSTGSQAIEAICLEYYDLILLDHVLPDLRGTDLLRLVKRFFPSTIVVMMTGQGSEEVAMEALRCGARDYLRKPFDLAELCARTTLLFQVRHRGPGQRHDVYLQLLADVPEGQPGRSEEQRRSILRAIRHIEAHLSEPFTLAGVARVAGMSKYHFCRQFRAVSGLSFREFIARRRVEQAQELLRDRRRGVATVAREVGFLDATHFARVFRKYAHLLPSEYRGLVTGLGGPSTQARIPGHGKTRRVA
jgi:YesN/AraC family two-component response regulator